MAVKKDWITELKVGDSVTIFTSGWGREGLKIVTVEKITPSGRINLSDQTVVNPDGYVRGNSRSHIEPTTDEIRTRIWRGNTIKRIESYKFDFEKMTDKELKELFLLLNQYPKVNELKG